MNHRPTIVPTRWRRLVRNLAFVGVVVSGLAMFGEVTQALPPGTPPAGTLTITPATGASDTTFVVTPPNGAACPGDNTNGFLYHTFITPATNDPADFEWGSSGTPLGEPAFTNNLANAIGTRSRTIQPGLGDGRLIAPANQSFAYVPLFGTLTPGEYWVGIACTVPDPIVPVVTVPGQDPPLPIPPVIRTVRFWTVPITITASVGAGPNNLRYTAPGAPSTTTTTTTVAPTTTTMAPGGTTSTTAVGGTTTIVGSTTTTTIACPTGSTTTTSIAGTTTTTATGASTTTSTTIGGTTTTNPCPTTTTAAPSGSGGLTPTTVRSASGAVAQSTGSGTGSTQQNLADTGSSTPTIVLWAILALVFGRMLVLMARPIRVSSDR